MATIYSNNTGGGDWHVGSTWQGGSVPAATDRVVIQSGDIIEIDGDTTIGDSPASQTTYVLDIYGTLKWKDNPGADWTFLIQGSTVIRPTGHLQIGTDANPIPSNRKATVTIAAYLVSAAYLIWLENTGGTASKGRITTRGSVAYHMASSAMHRARLTSAVSAGSAVAIEVDRAVDWQIGDVICFGRGGSQTTSIIDGSGNYLASYGLDRTTISGKTDSTHYTVTTLAYAHLAGDMVAHLSRNVIIQGTSGYGFCIYKPITANEAGGFSQHGGIDLSWTSLRYAGGGGSTYFHAVHIEGQTYNDRILDGDYKIEGCVFDEAGVSTASAIYMRSVNHRTTGSDINNTVVYGAFTNGLYTLDQYSYGRMSVGALTIIGATNQCVNLFRGSFHASSLWLVHNGVASSVSHSAVYCTYGGAVIDELLVHAAGYYGIVVEACSAYQQMADVQIRSGELYNARSVLLFVSTAYSRRVLLNDVKLAHSHSQMMCLNGMSNFVAYGCAFDNGNRSASTDGVILLAPAAYHVTSVLFKKCTFGTASRGYRSYLTLATALTRDGLGRVRLEDCTFKEPIFSTEPTWGLLGKWRGIIAFGQSNATWYATNVSRGFSFELVRPVVYDTSDVDQWPLQYPGVTQMALCGAGCELRNEATVILDGSFGMKMTPWAARAPGAGSWVAPYKIPVQAGDTITVKISLRKTVSQPAAKKRPRAYLRGCGVFDEQVMPDTNDTWEELTLTGVAATKGMVDFWVEPGYGHYVGVTEQNPWYSTVYADGLEISVV